MDMSQPNEQREAFAIDKTAVALIVALVIVIGPATIFASIWVLTHGFHVAATTPFEWVVTVLVSLLALVMIRAGVVELRGGLGVRIDEQGVHQRGRSIAWADVEGVEIPTYGLLELVAGDESLRLRTYLLRDPKKLLDVIGEKTGRECG